MARSLTACMISIITLAVLANAQMPREVGSFTTTNPGFLSVQEFGGTKNLLITSFTGNPFAGGDISVVMNVGASLANVSSIVPSSISTAFPWPNTVQYVDPNIFGINGLLLVCDGFLVPFKDKGSVAVVPMNGGEPVTLSTDKSGWFYHHAEWIDLNGDGKLDILTARGNKPILGASGAEFVWLEQPAENPLTSGPWVEHLISTGGPDVMFTITELDNNPQTVEVIASQFFANPGITLNQIAKSGGKLLMQTQIDMTIGSGYSVQLVDLNGDGKQVLFASNHMNSVDVSGIFAYELPSSVRQGNWTKHVVASGFTTVQFGPGAAAPGFPYPFYPQPAKAVGPMTIGVAGDGTNSAFILTPSGNGTPFSYSAPADSVLLDAGGTVGSLAIADVNGDGYVEVFVPNYDKGYVNVYTYAP